MVLDRQRTRIPYGKHPEDLGQVVKILAGKVVLVSFNSSPVTKHYKQVYSLFVLDNVIEAAISEIIWTVSLTTDTQNINVPFVDTVTDCILEVESEGELTVSVLLKFSDGTQQAIKMRQLVKASYFQDVPVLEANHAGFGNPGITLTILDNYLLELIRNSRSKFKGKGCLRYFVFSIMYYNLLHNGDEDLHSWIRKDSDFTDVDLREGVGICRIRPSVLAYFYRVLRPGQTTDFLKQSDDLINYDPSIYFIDDIKKLTRSDYDLFLENEKIDIKNLLYFPKTCIQVAIEWVSYYVGELFDGDSFDDCFADNTKLQRVVNQFFYGPYPSDLDITSNVSEDLNLFFGISDKSKPLLEIFSALSFVKIMLDNERYGNFILRKGDSDQTQTYDGAVRALADIEYVPHQNGHDANPRLVGNLKDDLSELGFDMFESLQDKNNPSFGISTQWAVREFQIYSSLPTIAQVYNPLQQVDNSIADSLRPVPNTLIYKGPKSGVFNFETQIVMIHWLLNHYRCPVVVSAFNMQAGQRALIHTDNIWRHDDVQSTAPRMFVKDFRNYYNIPDVLKVNYANGDTSDWTVLGCYSNLYDTGPVSLKNIHTWSNLRTTPERVTGKAWINMTASERSTYRVIAAVAEVECNSFCDSLNAYDSARISLGLAHWTFFAGFELGGLFSFYRANLNNRADYARGFDIMGIRPKLEWDNNNMVVMNALFNDVKRTYESSMLIENEAAEYAPFDNFERDSLKNWHSFYRFVMACRSINSFQKAQYDFIRLRIRDLKKTQYITDNNIPVEKPSNNSTRIATLEDIYSSEKAFAMLLRIHVNSPACVFKVANKIRSTILHKIYDGLTPGEKNEFFSNPDAGQTELIKLISSTFQVDAIDGVATTSIHQTINLCRDFRNTTLVAGETLTLSEMAGSFLFDESGLELYPSIV